MAEKTSSTAHSPDPAGSKDESEDKVLAEDAADTEAVDEELDDLLDSALQDFEKPSSSGNGEPPKEKKENCLNRSGGGLNDHPWTAEFSQFADVMNTFLEEEPQLKEQFTKITQTANRAATAATDEEFAATLNETLKSISDTALSFGDVPSDEELSRLMGSLQMEGASPNGAPPPGGVPGLVSMMQGMMQNLLSKELLYPALRDIVDKYPDWLAERRASLPVADYERYNSQYELMKQVCQEFEQEQPGDSAEVKRTRFDRILALMQKMQECGHPPKELVEISPELAGLDEHGNPSVPGLPDQCSLM
uniref:Peroxin-19 n=1 Tax=Ixodes ricinus TaxID=34613 RepID=A0A131Y2E4_IXORI